MTYKEGGGTFIIEGIEEGGGKAMFGVGIGC